MNYKESIQLKDLTFTGSKVMNQSVVYQTIKNSDITNTMSVDDFVEIYPNLKLTKEQAISRSKQFRIIPRSKKQDKSLVNKFRDHFNVWKSVNNAISRDYGDAVCSYFKINVWSTFNMMIISIISVSFVIIPMMILYQTSSSDTLPDYINQLFSSDQKWLINTPMFYGFYNQTINQTTNDTGIFYSIGKAYFYVNVICRVFYILCLLSKLIMNFSKMFAIILTTKLLITSIFVLWDYKKTNYREINYNKIIVKQFVKKIFSSHKEKRNFKILKNILINLLCYSISTLILERISWLLSYDEKYIQSHTAEEIPFWLILRVPITSSICITCATWLFDFIQCIEEYKNEYCKLSSSFARIVILNAGMIGLLLFHWTKVAWCTHMKITSQNFTSCYVLRDSIIIGNGSLLNTCWETWMGQRILLHFITFVITVALFTFSVDIIKSILKFLQISIFKPKFFQLCLFGNLFYLDCLFWLGFYYSPVIPIIYLFVLLLSYFYHMGMISVTCFPRISSIHFGKLHKTLFLCILLLSSIIASGCLIYQSATISPSKLCGPFQNLKHNYDSDNFSFSNYFPSQNLIWKMINTASDIIFRNDGVWCSIIIFILVFFFKYLFRAAALVKIRNSVQIELENMKLNKKELAADLKLEILKLKIDKSWYSPSKEINNELDLFFNQFSI